jgi:hypothetical protein
VRVIVQSGKGKKLLHSRDTEHYISNDPLQLLRQVDVHCLDVCVVRKGIFAKLATDTRLLISTERQLGVEGVVVVDPNSSGMQAVRGADGTGNISREDRGSQAVLIK